MSDTALRDLIYGKGAHVNPVACVEDISAELASRRFAGYPHSIWQIVLHMNYWMEWESSKIAGQNPVLPEHVIESWPAHAEPADESQWAAARSQWQVARQGLVDDLAGLASLADSDSATLDRTVSDVDPQKRDSRPSTVRALLWMIAVHNSYHAGQIALLRRQAGAWPPERGGFTW